MQEPQAIDVATLNPLIDCAYCRRALAAGAVHSIAVPPELGLPPFVLVCAGHVAPACYGRQAVAASVEKVRQVVIENLTGVRPTKLEPMVSPIQHPASAIGHQPASLLDRFVAWLCDWKIKKGVRHGAET